MDMMREVSEEKPVVDRERRRVMDRIYVIKVKCRQRTRVSLNDISEAIEKSKNDIKKIFPSADDFHPTMEIVGEGDENVAVQFRLEYWRDELDKEYNDRIADEECMLSMWLKNKKIQEKEEQKRKKRKRSRERNPSRKRKTKYGNL